MQRLIEDMHDGRQLARGHVEIAADLPMDNPANVAEVQDRNISAAITLIQRLLYERMLEQDMSAWKAAMRADGIGGDAEPDALPSESVKMAQQLAEQHRRRQAASPPPLPSQYTMRQLAPGEGVLLPSNTARTTTDDDPRLRGSGDIGAKHRMQFFDAMLIGIGLTALGYVARQILSGLPLFNLDNMPTFAGVVIGIICGGIVVGAFIYLITDSSQGEKPAHRLEETTPKSQPESPGDTP
jgi:hypothetical protein